MRIESPADAVRAGIGFLPEDRKQQGLVLRLSVERNMSLSHLGALARFGVLNRLEQCRIRIVLDGYLSYRRRHELASPTDEVRDRVDTEHTKGTILSLRVQKAYDARLSARGRIDFDYVYPLRNGRPFAFVFDRSGDTLDDLS